MINKRNQEDICVALANGNKSAFRKIFKLFYPRLKKYATHFIKNNEEAEDNTDFIVEGEDCYLEDLHPITRCRNTR